MKQSLLLLSFSRPGNYTATWQSSGFSCQRRGYVWILKIACFLEKLYWNGWLAVSFYLR